MVYEIIGKLVLYVIGTLLLGAFISAVGDDFDEVFFGAWIAGILVFLFHMISLTP